MCGIIGFYARSPEMREAMGRLIEPMLVCLGDRGPDSAGLAVFSEACEGGERRFNLFSADRHFPWPTLKDRWEDSSPVAVEGKSNHAVLKTRAEAPRVKEWLSRHFPELHLLSVGRCMDLYKDTGHPREIADRYDFRHLRGCLCVGHTRMATESAVTPVHSHPFVAGEDFCLVHNGSLSNHHSLRRKLEKAGIEFETDNDTEAACRFLEWRMGEGEDMEAALEQALSEVDGFFTLLIGTADRLFLIRDAFACKPAVVAEAEDYVAIGSEFRALAHLPGIEKARFFEPIPEKIYSWDTSTSRN